MSVPYPAPAPNSPTPRRSRNHWWLWAVGAALLTSAVWATGAMLIDRTSSTAIDKPQPDADLRGYHTVDDLCMATDVSAFTKAGFSIPAAVYGDRNPMRSTTTHPAVDSMACQMALDLPGKASTPTRGYLSVSVALNKQSNPASEFGASYQGRISGDFGPGNPEPHSTQVSGLGDEAFQVVRSSSTSNTSVELWVRDGWTVYRIGWDSSISSSDTNPPALSDSEALAKLRAVAEASLVKLRS